MNRCMAQCRIVYKTRQGRERTWRECWEIIELRRVRKPSTVLKLMAIALAVGVEGVGK